MDGEGLTRSTFAAGSNRTSSVLSLTFPTQGPIRMSDHRRPPRPIIGTFASKVSRQFPKLLVLGFGLLLATLVLITWKITLPIHAPEVGHPQIEHTRILGVDLTTSQASFYASVSATIFTGAGFFAAVIGLAISIHDRRKERAHSMASEWNTKEIFECADLVWNEVLPYLRRQDPSTPGLYYSIQRKRKHFNAIQKLLNILEDWSIAIGSGYVDRTVMERSMNTIFIGFYDGLEPFIKQARIECRDDTYYMELEAYVQDLKLRYPPNESKE